MIEFSVSINCGRKQKEPIVCPGDVKRRMIAKARLFGPSYSLMKCGLPERDYGFKLDMVRLIADFTEYTSGAHRA